ncbi:alpha/beta fold hydrolase [Streptomyces sulphureus]|uniref:alpha/beta fold hydrolase n=1 Tax=Streptomyces sulphureus TaxID=47758 RepID=UPI00036E38E4|nr:alpha/beta hydrolase [Streptomyces sulphureus]
MPYCNAANTRVHYRVAGEGAPVALVHGVVFDAEGTWGGLVDSFTDKHTVILPDYAGTAKAEDDGGELTVEALTEQVVAAIEAAAQGPVDLVGFSLGAVVSASVAATRPDLVRRLVLAAGWARPDDEYLRNLMTLWAGLEDDASFGRLGTLTAFSRGFLNTVGREQVEAIIAGGERTEGGARQVDLARRADIRELLPRVEAETLVIGCAQDATIPVELTRELHTAIQGSTYQELDCGHVAVIEKGPEFVKLVQEFIERP